MGRFRNLDGESAVVSDEVVSDEEEEAEDEGQVQAAQSSENEETITLKMLFHDKEVSLNECLDAMPIPTCMDRLKIQLGDFTVNDLSNTIHTSFIVEARNLPKEINFNVLEYQYVKILSGIVINALNAKRDSNNSIKTKLE